MLLPLIRSGAILYKCESNHLIINAKGTRGQ
jgi:hypothetical protein